MPTIDTPDKTRTTTEPLSREARIHLRAEEFYRRRGNRPVSAIEDWLLAEKEIREAEEVRTNGNALGTAGIPQETAGRRDPLRRCVG